MLYFLLRLLYLGNLLENIYSYAFFLEEITQMAKKKKLNLIYK